MVNASVYSNDATVIAIATTDLTKIDAYLILNARKTFSFATPFSVAFLWRGFAMVFRTAQMARTKTIVICSIDAPKTI
jgi:hypothetical protein